MPTDAVSSAVLLFERSDRLLMEFTGPKAAESLTGLVTNDVLGLRGGGGQYACALTAKGRIIADVRILAVPGETGAVERLLVDANAASGVGFAAMIRKYVNPRTAKYLDLSHAMTCLTLAGGGAIATLRGVADDAERLAPVETGDRFTHREITIGGVLTRVVRIPDLGDVPAFDVHVAQEHAAVVSERLLAAGATSAPMTDWHRLRVQAGWPEWGVDMDEGTLAQEANMDALQAISYRKGCYTGQETVARVHFRGHVNRTLRRVWYDDGAIPTVATGLLRNVEGVSPSADSADADALNATKSAAAALVGDARSAALAAEGRAVGIAMLRREVPDGAELYWDDSSGFRHVARVEGAADT